MNAALQRSARILVASLLALASILIAMFLTVSVVIALGTFWVSSTSQGRTWLSTQLSTLTADSGYRIDICRIRPLGGGRIGIDALAIYSGDHPVVFAQKIVFTPSIAALLNNELAVDLQARAVLLYSLPEAPPDAEPPPPFAPPIPTAAALHASIAALPFDSVRLDDLKIATFAIMDSQGNPSYVLHPSMTAHAIKTTDGADLTFEGEAKGLLENNAATRITATTELNLTDATPKLLVNALTVSTPAFEHTLHGYFDLPTNTDTWVQTFFELHMPLGQGNTAVASGAFQQDIRHFKLYDLTITAPGLTANAEALRQDDWSGAAVLTADVDVLKEYIPALASIDLNEQLEIGVSFDYGQIMFNAKKLNYMGAQLRNLWLGIEPLAKAPAGSHDVWVRFDEASSTSEIEMGTHLIYGEDGKSWALENIDASLSNPKAGKLALAGRADAKTLDITLTADKFRPDRLKGVLDIGDIPPVRLDDMKLHASGNMASPVITLDGVVAPAALPKGAPAVSAAITAKLAEGVLDASAALKSRALSSGGATLKQPMTLSLSPFAFDIKQGALDGAASLRGNLSALGGFMPAGLSLSGDANLAVLATGSLAKPDTSGTLSISNARLRDNATGIALQNINLKGRFDAKGIAIESLSARDNRHGKLQGNGRLTLAPGSWPVDAQLKLTDIDPFTQNASAISSMPVVDGVLDADLKLNGTAKRYTLAGTVGSDKLDITLPATFSSSVPQLNIVEKGKTKGAQAPGLAALALDIAVNVPRQIFVRGWGLDAEFGGALKLTGTAAQPSATGTLQSLRGRYEEFGRRFTLARAKLDFRGAIPPSPYLDIVAETKVDGITAQVVLGASAVKPKITFTSDPPLPQEDVLSRILFGRERASISPTQALQMAQTLRRFSGGGQGLDPLGRLRSGIGLDDLSVDSDEDGGTSVGAGKYLSDDVYLEVGGGEKGGAAKVQIELTPNVKVESKVGQEAGAGGGIFWEWEY